MNPITEITSYYYEFSDEKSLQIYKYIDDDDCEKLLLNDNLVYFNDLVFAKWILDYNIQHNSKIPFYLRLNLGHTKYYVYQFIPLAFTFSNRPKYPNGICINVNKLMEAQIDYLISTYSQETRLKKLSHDLKSPLNTQLIYLELLEESIYSESISTSLFNKLKTKVTSYSEFVNKTIKDIFTEKVNWLHQKYELPLIYIHQIIHSHHLQNQIKISPYHQKEWEGIFIVLSFPIDWWLKQLINVCETLELNLDLVIQDEKWDDSTNSSKLNERQIILLFKFRPQTAYPSKKIEIDTKKLDMHAQFVLLMQYLDKVDQKYRLDYTKKLTLILKLYVKSKEGLFHVHDYEK